MNHRGFATELAEREGLALPGEALVEDLAGFRAWLSRAGASASPSGRWLVREPFAAAGRGRRMGSVADWTAEEASLARMFRENAALHCAPLMERIDDFALVGLALDEGLVRVGWHRQEMHGLGRFSGLRLRPSEPWPNDGAALDIPSRPEAPSSDADFAPEIGESERERLDAVFSLVGHALMGEGYRGPFGIDAWRYRDASGKLHLHALGEINARLTMGHLAWAHFARLGAALGWTRADEVGFRIGPVGTREILGTDGLVTAEGPGGAASARLNLASWPEKLGEVGLYLERLGALRDVDNA